MHPQLAKLNEQFTEAGALAESVCQGLTDEQVRLRPELNHWCIAECLGHLNLSSEAFIDETKTACNEARQQQLLSSGPFNRWTFPRDRPTRWPSWNDQNDQPHRA